MSHANSPSVLSEDEVQTGVLPSIPKTALKALEPVSGGSWAVTGKSKDTYSLTYRTKGGKNDVSFKMRPCTTENDIRSQCGQFFYDINSKPVLSTAPINPNRHAIDKLLLEGKKHKRPLKSSPQPIHHGSSGQANDVGAPVPVTQSQDVAGSISFNQFAPYQAPVSPTSTYPSLPTPPYLTLAPSGNDLGFSLLEQYNHQAATPSGADRWDRAVSGNLAAINYALGTCEHQNIAFQQQGMALQQQAISLNQRQIQPDHHLMNTGQSAFIEGYSNEQDPMSTEFDDSFSTPMTYESWTHNGGWDSAFKSP